MDMEKKTSLDPLKTIIVLIENEGKKKEEIITELNKCADELDVKQRDMNIAKTAFASSGILGTGLTIAGIVAAPFTFGASLGLTVSGIAVGVASSAGGLATNIADWIINSSAMKNAQVKVDEYQEIVNTLVKLIEDLKVNYKKEYEQLYKSEIDGIKDEEQRLTLESILNGLKTTMEIGGGGARAFAVAGVMAGSAAAAAGKATVATGRTVMEALETGMKAVKVGGVVLSVLTVPIDIHTMISNSIKIHKETPSETAEGIRKLARQLEDYSMVSKQTKAETSKETVKKETGNESEVVSSGRREGDAMDVVEAVSTEVKKLVSNVKQLERSSKQVRELSLNVRQYMKDAVDEVPRKLGEMASDQNHHGSWVSSIKITFLIGQILGTLLIIIGLVSSFLHMGYNSAASYGVVAVVTGGVLNLVTEMFREIRNSLIWSKAETELDKYLHTIKILVDVERKGTSGRRSPFIGNECENFRHNLQKRYGDTQTYRDFILVSAKLVIDVLVLVLSGIFDPSGTSQRHQFSDAVVGMQGAVSLPLFPVDVYCAARVGVLGSLLYLLTMPVCVYMLMKCFNEFREESKISRNMRNLGEDFKTRFNHLLAYFDARVI